MIIINVEISTYLHDIYLLINKYAYLHATNPKTNPKPIVSINVTILLKYIITQ